MRENAVHAAAAAAWERAHPACRGYYYCMTLLYIPE